MTRTDAVGGESIGAVGAIVFCRRFASQDRKTFSMLSVADQAYDSLWPASAQPRPRQATPSHILSARHLGRTDRRRTRDQPGAGWPPRCSRTSLWAASMSWPAN